MSDIPSTGLQISDLGEALATAAALESSESIRHTEKEILIAEIAAHAVTTERARKLEAALSEIVTILVNSSDCRSVLLIARGALAKGGHDG